MQLVRRMVSKREKVGDNATLTTFGHKFIICDRLAGWWDKEL